MQTQPYSIMKLQSILKRLLVCEIVVIILAFMLAFTPLAALPPLLQQYEDSLMRNWTSRDWALLCLGIPLLSLTILAWVALWRGWRTGRRLYTVAWGVSLSVNPFIGPTVTPALVDTLGTLETLLGGILLGLLYFSDLRYQYVPIDA